MSDIVTLQGPNGPFQCTAKQARTTYKRFAADADAEPDETPTDADQTGDTPAADETTDGDTSTGADVPDTSTNNPRTARN